MWPQNLMFFLFPSILIILVFFILPFMNRKKEPFGYKSEGILADEKFEDIKKVYWRKLFLFSVPFSIAISISNLFILSTFTGTVFLVLLILGLGAVNFIFYMQAYREVKFELSEKTIENEESTDETEESGLPKW